MPDAWEAGGWLAGACLAADLVSFLNICGNGIMILKFDDYEIRENKLT